MKKLYPLQNSIKNYDWGSSQLMKTYLGYENPTGEPQAELWMGVHERGMSMAKDGKTWIPLDQLIRRNIVEMIGEDAAKRFGNLPFLFKVLAAAKPLSIQAHPNKQQAEEGFAKENTQGIPMDASVRNYHDSNHKPEVTCALTDEFWAMCGFRKIEEIIYEFESLQLPVFEPLLQILKNEESESTRLEQFFAHLMDLPIARLSHVIDDVVRYAEHQEGDHYRWLKKLQDIYPGDIGVLSPLYLNVFCLKKGQAVYLEAGKLHAYLDGMAVELMANSDNVLRGGLTTKHMDISQLMHVLTFESFQPEILEAEGPDGTYQTPSTEFSMHRLSLGADYFFNGRNSAQIILCTQGRITLETAPANTGASERVVLQRGESVFMPYHAGGYIATGKGDLFLAQIPEI
ncbi:MAG: mannose-6-phosphate isomerase, class I [Spirochaetia bacterium]